MDVRLVAWAGYELKDYTLISGTGIGGGSVELEEGWQLVSIPVEYGYWSTATHSHVHDGATRAKFKNYVLDQINDTVGSGLVEVSNTYVGDVQAFYSYVPDVTPDSSEHNWQLVYDDGIHREISGFWIKTLSGTITIVWGE